MKTITTAIVLIMVMLGNILPAYAFNQVSGTVLRAPNDIQVQHMVEDSNKYLTWWAPGTPKWLYYSSIYDQMMGTGNAGEYDAAIKLDAVDMASYQGYEITKIGIVPVEPTAIYTLKIWVGENADSVVYVDTIKSLEYENWNYITLKEKVRIDSGQVYYFGYNIISLGGYPIGCEKGIPENPGKSDLIRLGSTFQSIYETQGIEVKINIAAYAELPSSKGISSVIQADINTNTVAFSTLDVKQANKLDILRPGAKISSDIPDSYNIYRNNVVVGTSESNEYHDILPEGGLFTYSVSAVYGEEESEKSNSIEVLYDTKRIPVNRVVTETFINVGGGSPASPSVFEGMAELNYHNRTRVAPITYHAATEILGDDPYSNLYAEDRFMYYILSTYSFPMAIFNGDYFLGGGSSEQSLYPIYQELFNYVNNRKTPVSLKGNLEKVSSGAYTLNIDSKIVGTYPDTDMVLQVVLVEGSISHYWDDSTFSQVQHVAVEMFPGSSGTPLVFDENGEVNKTIDINISPLDDPNKYKIVAFIQNNKSQWILNGDEFVLPTKKNVEFSVTGIDNEPLGGANIIIGEEIFETDQNGKSNVGVLNTAGEVSYTISKDKYTDYQGVFNIDTTTTVQVSLLLSDLNLKAVNNVKIYPNPASNLLNIKVSETSTIQFANSAGVIVKEFEQINSIQQCNVSELKQGVYVIIIRSNNTSTIQRFIKL